MILSSEARLPVALYRYRNPLQTPLRFAGRALTARQGLLLKFVTERGVCWGECAPLPGFSLDSLAHNQNALLRWLEKGGGAEEALPTASQFALSSGRWWAQHWPTAALSMPAAPLLVGTPAAMWQQAQRLSAPAVVKLKLARAPLADEIHLVQRLVKRWPALRLRIDANRGWSAAQACAFAEQVPLAALDYVEEPCHSLAESLWVHQHTGLPLALDETTQQPDYRYQSYPGVRALVLKPTLIGSLARLQHLIRQAHQDELACVLSSSFESNLGLQTLAALAAWLTPTQAPGLDTLSALSYDLCQPNGWCQPRPLLLESQLELLWQ